MSTIGSIIETLGHVIEKLGNIIEMLKQLPTTYHNAFVTI